MMRLDGARWFGNLRAELVLAILVARDVFGELGFDCRLTCGANGTHSSRSHHYKGDAVDFGVAHIPEPRRRVEADRAAGLLRERLGRDFVIIVEHTNGIPTHIHCAFRPDPTLV